VQLEGRQSKEGIMTLGAQDLIRALQQQAGQNARPAKRPGLDADHVHEHAIAVLNQLRGLSKGDKRRVLRRAEKLLDA
jgi:hypothetical protein